MAPLTRRNVGVFLTDLQLHEERQMRVVVFAV